MSLVAGLVLLFAAQADANAAPPPSTVTLVCTGSGVREDSMKKDGKWESTYTPIQFTHKITVAPSAPAVTFNGKSMEIWSFTDTEIVFAKDKKGRLNTIFDLGPVYTIDRQTGTFRYQRGSGMCAKVADQPNLF